MPDPSSIPVHELGGLRTQFAVGNGRDREGVLECGAAAGRHSHDRLADSLPTH
ncbi:hypothetical protein AB0D59_35820 [Streptomyces sp. NPDC048417]|uniref:hypothetical protein n=1 Tax=Streptomyces sp. NPDC048417 TaxID=3155387 RepID=UPI003432E38C